MKTSLLSIIFLIVCISGVYATPQQPDILMYKGKEYPIYWAPLDSFFEKNPDRRPKFCGGRSSLWRGYIAYIEIVKDELILKDIKIHTVNPYDPDCLKESKLSEVAP